MFKKIQMAPPDPILGLTEAFRSDPNPDKINLGVGVYKDELGRTPIMSSVKKAEQRILESETTKSYLPISGDPDYGVLVQKLLFGPDSEIIKNKRAVTAQTPGGTGALRVAGDLLNKFYPEAKLYLSDPTWANHHGIFDAAGFDIETYPYYEAQGRRLDFDKMIEFVKNIGSGDIILLHGCCHNPTGVDPDPDQWKTLAEVLAVQKPMVLFDFAYQGLSEGIDADAAGLRTFCQAGFDMLITSSCSKNFGLYNERVGALTAVCQTSETAQKAFSHLKLTIRRNYSNPPSHGKAIVTTILSDPELRAEWESEVTAVRERIAKMRILLVKTLQQKGVEQDFSFITKQKGMFSFSGLTKLHVDKLRKDHSIYIVGSGRINVAGITEANVERLCDAIAEVLND